MSALLRFAAVLDRISRTIGKGVSWIVLALIFMIMLDVITRKIDFIKQWSAEITRTYGYSVSFILQDLEWHVHGILLLLTFGFGYIMNAHVRVDIFRESASRRRQVWIETVGLLVCAIPFLLVMIHFSWTMTHASFVQGEGSESQVGLGWRFIIKSFLITGFTVALMAVLATLFRCFAYLWGNDEERAAAEESIQFFTDHDASPKPVLQRDQESGPESSGARGGGAGHA